jgi:hypothetical protein
MFNLLLRDVTRLCEALHTISFWIVFVVNPSLSLGLRWLRNSQRLIIGGSVVTRLYLTSAWAQAACRFTVSMGSLA